MAAVSTAESVPTVASIAECTGCSQYSRELYQQQPVSQLVLAAVSKAERVLAAVSIAESVPTVASIAESTGCSQYSRELYQQQPV